MQPSKVVKESAKHRIHGSPHLITRIRVHRLDSNVVRSMRGSTCPRSSPIGASSPPRTARGKLRQALAEGAFQGAWGRAFHARPPCPMEPPTPHPGKRPLVVRSPARQLGRSSWSPASATPWRPCLSPPASLYEVSFQVEMAEFTPSLRTPSTAICVGGSGRRGGRRGETHFPPSPSTKRICPPRWNAPLAEGEFSPDAHLAEPGRSCGTDSSQSRMYSATSCQPC